MLSAASADLVARDRGIPGLAIVLDGDAFAAAVASGLGGLKLHGSRLTYVRYKPRVSCLVVHELSTAIGPVEVYAKAHAEPASEKLSKAGREPAGSGALPGTLILERDVLIVRGFPNDAKLRNVAVLGDAGRTSALLERVLSKGPQSWSESLTNRPLERLAYKPERRFVARLGENDPAACVLRFYRSEAFERANGALRCVSSREVLRVPKRVGASRSNSVLALEWLLGERLREQLRLANWDDQPLRRTGVALAELHSLGPKSLPARSRAAEIHRLEQLALHLGFLVPDLARSVTGLVGRLSSWLSAQPEPTVLIHGDFYDKQVLLDEGRIGVLDLDEVVVGDPRADLGTFIAHLERDAVRKNIAPERVADSAEGLLAGYTRAGALPIAADWPQYAAIGLVQLAHHPFRSGEPEWVEQTTELLERAVALSSGAKLGPATSAPPTPVIDPSESAPARAPRNGSRPDGLRIVSLNQDPGVSPTRMKGAAVHLCAMREAFRRLESEVLAVDESDESRVADRLERAERDRPIDLIYERYALGKSAGAEFARERGIPYSLEVNAPLADEGRRWRGLSNCDDDLGRDRFVFAQAECVVAVSQQVAEYAIELGARPSAVQVWANGVDLDHFHPAEPCDDLRGELVPEGRFVLGFHGRLRPWHGFDLLAEACGRLLDSGASVHLLAVGEGDFESVLERYVEEEFRTLVGWQPHDEVGRYVACFDALPLTYRAGEPCYFSPLKLAEAMACEVVPIVPAAGDLPSMVEHGADGLIYPAGSVEDLTTAIRDLIADPARKRAMGRKARERAGRHSWDRIAESILSFAR